MTTMTQTVVEGSARVWSSEQEAIFAWFAQGAGNLVVRARAGTGKTTTIVAAIDHAPETSILLCAFNKKIAEELTSRITNGAATAKTLHAIGFSIVRRYWNRVQVARADRGRCPRADGLTDQVCSSRTPDDIKKLVTKLHTKGREIAPHAREVGDLTDIMYQFDLVPDEEWAVEGFDGRFVEQHALRAMEVASKSAPSGIDFADMIFLPVRNRWMAKSYDLVVVDEAQDMTIAQLELAQGVCRGRFVVVGDDRQAIYAFRGADSNSLDRLKTALNAEELTLRTTYRCGRTIVNAAQALVPDFTAGDNNPEGEVIEALYAQLGVQATHGDFILSRTNAPLVSTAMKLLKSGKRARVAGRDIGAGLVALVRKLSKGAAAKSIPEFLERVSMWEQREAHRMAKAGRESKVDEIRDKAEMLIELASESDSVQALITRIEALFTDDGLGQAGIITCSSVHRSKGLEANRVFVLSWTLKGGNREEENIQYVAITRAKQTLVMVLKGDEA